MALNVLAVTDVFLRLIRKNAEHFYGRKKMWRNKNVQRAESPNTILCSPSRRKAAKQLQSCYAM
jgi:hypothetical protein